MGIGWKNASQGLAAGIAAVALSGAAAAEGVGYIGLSLGYVDGNHSDPQLNESFSGAFGVIEGAYAYPLGNGRLVFDGVIRRDDIGPLDSGEDSMDGNYYLTVHYLVTLSGGTMLGGFAGYSMAGHSDNDNEDYETIYGGLEIIRPLTDTLVAYGQLTVADTLDEQNMNSGGFAQGKAVRVGVQYTGWGLNTITAELEGGYSWPYEDNDEDGQFGSLFLGLERPLNDRASINFGLRHALFNAREDEDILRETVVSLGIRYNFGGSSGGYVRQGIIGTPYIPTRAAAWVPALD